MNKLKVYLDTSVISYLKGHKPILSPNFTIDDIHKLREYNYYQTKDMTVQERMDYYNSRGIEVHKEIQMRKLQKG